MMQNNIGTIQKMTNGMTYQC